MRWMILEIIVLHFLFNPHLQILLSVTRRRPTSDSPYRASIHIETSKSFVTISWAASFVNTMPSRLSAALFITGVAAANITTSIWLPGSAKANETFLGSVIEQNGDQTVLALAYARTPSSPDYFTSAPNRAIVGGTTFVAYNATASDSLATNAVPVTIALQCRRSSGSIEAVPTCTLSTIGAGQLVSSLCAGLTVTSLPAYCTASSAVNYQVTQTFSGESQYYINNYPLIITAGTEKLGAAAAATPNAGSVSVTGSAVRSGSRTVAAPSQTSFGASGSVLQATGAAIPIRTMAPALAGMGAAAAAFFF